MNGAGNPLVSHKMPKGKGSITVDLPLFPLFRDMNDNRRIAKNTVYLYIRTFLVMLIALYTSRVILQTLGVNDYGIFNAVGGVVSMFQIISGSLAAAISRYITFALGKGNMERLRQVFSTSMMVQILIGVAVLILGETLGLWFVNTYMNIPEGRMEAANWVWHCSLFSFVIGLIYVPFNAMIIAHEHMNMYAFLSIFDAVAKLVIVLLLPFFGLDRLALYSILLVGISLTNFSVYYFYCRHHFCESHFEKPKDMGLIKEITNFAGFSFLNNAANILNSQGLNVLINIFFGVAFNAARGIATQVEGAVMQFVDNIIMAINPQITKSYAVGDKGRMFMLVCSGSRFAYFLMLFFALPVFLETDFILKLWLGTVPEYTVVFVHLSLIGSMVKMLGNTGYTACMATGNIKRYSIIITVVGIFVFPLVYLAFKLSAPVEWAYYIFIAVYTAVLFVRLGLMKQMIEFPPQMFIKEVLLPVSLVTIAAVIAPLIVLHYIEAGWLRLISVLLVSTVSCVLFIYLIGLKRYERDSLMKTLANKIKFTK